MKYIYLHVLFFDDIKFYKSLVRQINDDVELRPKDHFFVTCYMNVYESIKEFSNVRFINKRELFYYMFFSKFVIFHSMSLKKWQFLLLPKFMIKKIIWRTWGHDIRPYEKNNNILLNVLKSLEFKLFKNRIKHIYAMGIANEIDIVNIEEVFKYKFKYFVLNYTNSSDLVRFLKGITPTKNDEYLKILVGHNCSPVDNHLEILDKLKKFKNEKIHLIIPLSYSNPNNGYKEEIIKKAINTFGKSKISILDDFISLNDYIKLISTIDIAIMDMYFSNGLGNISYILYFKKKLYVRNGSNFDVAFRRENIFPNYTSEITLQSFDEFKCNYFNENYLKFCKDLMNEDMFKKNWLKFMNESNGVNYE